MEDPKVAQILEGLQSPRAQEAWKDFLEAYSSLILRVVKMVESDPDRMSDIFVYVCEGLARKRFRRLRRFEQNGPASFSTWIQTVVRNLCMDWFRSKHGRSRQFQTIQKLPQLEQRVFQCHYEQGLSLEETLQTLQPSFGGLTEQRVDEAFERIRNSLTRRQQKRLLDRRSPLVSLAASDSARILDRASDPNPGPEDSTATLEHRRLLRRALLKVSARDRLLVRLRYFEGMTLSQIAQLTGVENAQKVDRQIKQVLAVLRELMD